MSLIMSRLERESFLAGTHVAIFAVADEGHGPLAGPVWYRYTPGGDVCVAIGPESRKARLLARGGRASLCVQTEAAPYQYVSVEGPTTIGPTDFEADIREMAIRYLGPKLGEAYLRTTYPQGTTSEVLVRLRPERWASRDFRKMGRA
jgi:nitroimidazol reductase NimA-like FMN-containing flavoprotein (pyridoxamine 5'-phosphate oxidase superfamily)